MWGIDADKAFIIPARRRRMEFGILNTMRPLWLGEDENLDMSRPLFIKETICAKPFVYPERNIQIWIGYSKNLNTIIVL